MKKTLFILVAFFTFYASNSYAQDVEIKGLYIGLDKDAAEKIAYFTDPFTIAGIEPNRGRCGGVWFDENNKLERFLFCFDSRHFSKMHEAIFKKYENILCEDSEITNRMGVKFDQIHCKIDDDVSVLTLLRYVDATNSLLSIESKKLLQKKAEEREKDIDDI